MDEESGFVNLTHKRKPHAPLLSCDCGECPEVGYRLSERAVRASRPGYQAGPAGYPGRQERRKEQLWSLCAPGTTSARGSPTFARSREPQLSLGAHVLASSDTLVGLQMSPQPALQPSPWSQMVGARACGDGEQPRTSPGCVVALGSQTVAGTTWARWDEEKEGLAEGCLEMPFLQERGLEAMGLEEYLAVRYSRSPDTWPLIGSS